MRVAALLGAEDGCLLLRLAHHDDSLGAVEARPVLLGDVVLALPLGEGDQGDLFLLDEAVDCGDEGFAYGVHESRGGEGLSAVKAEECSHATVSLQPGLVDVEVHPVDAFDFESHVFAEHFGDSTW